MNCSRHIVLFLAIAMISLSTGDATAQKPSAKIVEYGRYKVVVVSLKPDENVSGSVTVQTKDHKHIETTKKIPRRIGESWGYRVEWRNLPRMRAYEFKTEMHHPPIKQPDGKILKKSVHVYKMDAGTVPDPLILNWYFLKGFEYELVPGKWTMKVFVDAIEVASMTFEVEK